VLREDFSSRPDVVERFRQEAKSASRIGHEHIIDISDFGVTPSGANYFVMELLNGHDLASELEQKGPLSPRRTVNLALQCCRALGAAHAKGIVHRDMKPENIFLCTRESGEDFIKIVDFGIAKMSDVETDGTPGRKLTKTGMIFGTPEYMSPEQAGGKKLDHRVDVYAMGVILYELLTGKVPFVGDTFMGILTQHMFEKAAPIGVANPASQTPPELERIVFRALAKSADERYQSMDELAQDLQRALSDAPGTQPVLVRHHEPQVPGTVTHHGYGQNANQDPRSPRLHLATPATEMSSRRESSSGMMWVAGGVAAAAIGIAAFFALRTQPMAAEDQKPAAVIPASTIPAPAPPVAPAPAPVEPTQISVQVDSEPRGAAVRVNGVEVCSGTPCTFSAEPGKEVEIEATRSGYKAASTRLTPSENSSPLTLTLTKRSARPASNSGTHSSGDLKIPDAFGR
jgi:eukaryotic-like serine/threonine-protein kinase